MAFSKRGCRIQVSSSRPVAETVVSCQMTGTEQGYLVGKQFGRRVCLRRQSLWFQSFLVQRLVRRPDPRDPVLGGHQHRVLA